MKTIRKLTCLVISILLLYSNNMEVYALELQTPTDNQELLLNKKLDLDKQINYIEEELYRMDYSVEKSISDNIGFYKNLLKGESLTNEEIKKINILIYTLKQQLGEYTEYKNQKESIYIKNKKYIDNRLIKNNISNALPDPYKTIRVTIATVNAWFYAKGYFLSSELLTHAMHNKNKSSFYSPVNGSIVTKSPVYTKLKNKPYRATGTDRFPNSGTTVQKDLYYSIHKFRWERASSGYLIIRDYYDFEPGKYTGIQSIAVDNMYLAQKLGVLTPYNITISK